jgi:tripartite-type tricarboxylate transporter receptor subunit TctC
MYRRNRSLMAAATLALVPLIAQAQGPAAYPTKPIRIIVAGPPGIPPDVVARILGERLAAPLGQPVVIENRPGTSGVVGLDALAKSAADAYTLGIISMPVTVTPSLVARVPYDMERDFAPVGLVAWAYPILAVSVAKPMKSVADLVAAAKAKPGALNFASGGNGTPPHLAGELFKRVAGVDIIHVPYNGAVAGVAAVLSGDADMMIGATGAMSPHVKAGKLRALATSSPRRIAAFPDLPTFVELGYDVEVRDWLGFLAPAGTRRDLVERLHSEMAKVTATPETRQRLEALGVEVADMGPEEFRTHIRSELQKWAKVVRDAGIKPD